MLDVSSLYSGLENDGDPLRYGKRNRKSGHKRPDHGSLRKPVVVFNITRACNLECIHCYSGSSPGRFPGQLTTRQIKAVLDDLSNFEVPAVLLSGGEPMVHPDFWEILEYGIELGLRITVSTNGTLIGPEEAERFKQLGVTYIGISLDGMEKTNDEVRGMKGAFQRTVRAFHHCGQVGQKVGLRLTLTRYNVDELDDIFDFIREQGIQRVCFYHLAYAGRGNEIRNVDLSHSKRRWAVRKIFERTRELNSSGYPVEVLTVGNFVDNVFLFKHLREENPEYAEKVRKMLEWNGGGLNSSGVGIGAIDFYGRVHPNRFWMTRTLGNVKQRPFTEIWTDGSNEFLNKLRSRLHRLTGKCSTCRFVDMCGGGLRIRATANGDAWGPDPSCYLTEREREETTYLA